MSPVLAGIFYAAGVLGTVTAFICGGFMLELYTHFDTIDTSSSVSNHSVDLFLNRNNKHLK